MLGVGAVVDTVGVGSPVGAGVGTPVVYSLEAGDIVVPFFESIIFFFTRGGDKQFQKPFSPDKRSHFLISIITKCLENA